MTRLHKCLLAESEGGAEGLTRFSCRITKDEISIGGIRAKVSKVLRSDQLALENL